MYVTVSESTGLAGLSVLSDFYNTFLFTLNLQPPSEFPVFSPVRQRCAQHTCRSYTYPHHQTQCFGDTEFVRKLIKPLATHSFTHKPLAQSFLE